MRSAWCSWSFSSSILAHFLAIERFAIAVAALHWWPPLSDDGFLLPFPSQSKQFISAITELRRCAFSSFNASPQCMHIGKKRKKCASFSVQMHVLLCSDFNCFCQLRPYFCPKNQSFQANSRWMSKYKISWTLFVFSFACARGMIQWRLQ